MSPRSPLRLEPALRWLQSFLSREWPLALPIALAFLGLPPLAVVLAMPRLTVSMPLTLPQIEAIMAAMPAWFAPAMIALSLLTIIGALALAALAVIPRISVREALAIGVRRLPVWLALAVLAGTLLIVALSVVATLLALIGVGQAGLILLMIAVFVIAGCFLVLMIPLVVDRPGGPIVALRAGWTLYRRWLLKLGGGLCLFWLGMWVVAFAVQVGLGSLVLVLAKAAGQEAFGRLLAVVVSSFTAALHWGAFYLFAAALYRVVSGVQASRGI